MALKAFTLLKLRTAFRSLLVRCINTPNKLTEKDVEEIQIPVPWGHISGKWWGSRDKQPILCLHGWQDNANTFDTLIPHLPPEFSYLAVDLPGHGLSSQLPKGILYRSNEAPTIIRRIQQYFKWEKVSFIGHSFGAICSFLFSSVFSKEVIFFVAIDSVKPLMKNIDKEIKNGSKIVEEMLLHDSSHISVAVEYKRDEIIKMWIKGSNNSLTEKSCEILMQRGAHEENGLFKLRRDSRLKNSFLVNYPQIQTLEMAEKIKCRVLYIKALDWPYLENEQDVTEIVQVLKKTSKHFEEHHLPGTHHLHLNTPEVVAPVISAFVKSIPAE